MVALVASVFFPYVVVIAAGRELPRTPAGWLFWLGVGVVLALVAKALGRDPDMRTRGVGALVVLGGGVLVFVVWVMTGGRFPPP